MVDSISFLKDVATSPNVTFEGPFSFKFNKKDTPLVVEGAELAKSEGYLKSIDTSRLNECILIIDLNPSAYDIMRR